MFRFLVLYWLIDWLIDKYWSWIHSFCKLNTFSLTLIRKSIFYIKRYLLKYVVFFIRVSWQTFFLPNFHLDHLISSSTVNTKCFYLDILVSQNNFPIQTSWVFSCGCEMLNGKIVLFCFVFLNPARAFLHWFTENAFIRSDTVHSVRRYLFIFLLSLFFRKKMSRREGSILRPNGLNRTLRPPKPATWTILQGQSLQQTNQLGMIFVHQPPL